MLTGTRDENGAVVIVFALALVVLLTFAAFVVDLGPAYVARRKAQTTADAAALTGAQALSVNRVTATQSAMDVARFNTSTVYTDTAWNNLWAACTDPSRDPARYPIVATASPCISFGNGSTSIRVRLPNQILQTGLAKVIGVSTMKVSADAQARAAQPVGGGVLPFAVAGFATDIKNQICYTVAGACRGSNSDTLRSLDSPLVANPQYGNLLLCRPTQPGTRIEVQVAMGMDHVLIPKQAAQPTRRDDCDIELPNTLYTKDLGNATNQTEFIDGLKAGLITGPTTLAAYPDTKPARLKRLPTNFTGWETRQVAGATVDNRPLWEFIETTTAAPDIPTTCERRPTNNNFNPATFAPDPDAGTSGKGRMLQCLNDYITGNYTKPLFTAHATTNPPGIYDIQLSPRLGFVPSIPVTCCPSPDPGQPIDSVHPIFIQTLYLDQNNAKAQLNPGEGGTNPLPIPKFDGISALRLTDNMLPNTITKTGSNGTLHGATIALTA